jgi:hypothetical protein
LVVVVAAEGVSRSRRLVVVVVRIVQERQEKKVCYQSDQSPARQEEGEVNSK